MHTKVENYCRIMFFVFSFCSLFLGTLSCATFLSYQLLDCGQELSTPQLFLLNQDPSSQIQRATRPANFFFSMKNPFQLHTRIQPIYNPHKPIRKCVHLLSHPITTRQEIWRVWMCCDREDMGGMWIGIARHSHYISKALAHRNSFSQRFY